jgi:hypothetical protein
MTGSWGLTSSSDVIAASRPMTVGVGFGGQEPVVQIWRAGAP